MLSFVCGLGFAFKSFAHGIDATAKILAIQVVFVRKLDGTLVTTFFLEVGGQALDSINVTLFLHDFIKHLRIFHRTDGERCCKVVAIQFFGDAGRFCETQLETFAASFASFGLILESAGDVVKFFRVVLPFNQCYWILCFKFGNESFDFIDSMLIFFGWCNIWIVIENRNFEVLG